MVTDTIYRALRRTPQILENIFVEKLLDVASDILKEVRLC